MKDSKHTNFELSLKEQLEDFEIPYNPEEWESFEQKLNNEVKIKPPKKIKHFFKNNFKNILLIFSLITNILILIFVYYYLQNFKNDNITEIIEQKKVVYLNSNSQDTNQYIILENKINSLQKDINKLHKNYTTKAIIEGDTIKIISENIFIDSTLIINKIDSIIINNNVNISKLDTIINEQNTGKTKFKYPTTEEYFWKDLTQPPMFKDKRGKYHFIPDLEGYISSEFQPSNLKNTYNEEITYYFTFLVDKKGQVNNFQPLRTVNPDVEKEVMRIVKGMPDWQAGQNEKGDTVVTKINFKFNIILKKSNPFPNF